MTAENDPIRLFVTHLYAPDESYFRVFEYLESQPNFFYKNLSTPDKPPRSKEKEAIREDLRRQMTDAEVVIVLSTLYLRDPTAIEYQCLYAQSCDKPLVVMEPFGTTEAVPAIASGEMSGGVGPPTLCPAPTYCGRRSSGISERCSL